MKPLDLRHNPPRMAASLELGIYFLPRTIDKARAKQVGGNLDVYRISAPEVTTYSVSLFEAIGLTEDEFVQLVSDAESDADIVRWIETHSDPQKVEQWNAAVSRARICDLSERGRASLFESNPSTKSLPPETRVIDALDLEDQRNF